MQHPKEEQYRQRYELIHIKRASKDQGKQQEMEDLFLWFVNDVL